MNIQSNVSSRQRPDAPATFESLNDDTLTTTLQFVGDKSYVTYAGVNKRCREVYLSSGMTKKTFLYGYAPLSIIQDKCEYARKGGGWGASSHFSGCGSSSYSTSFESAGKGVIFFNRRDVMDWALEEKNYKVMIGICDVAAQEGRIELLKWLELKGVPIDRRACAREAAYHGQLHIMKWLKEEKGLKLEEFFFDAARGGQLHVMRWLREKEVDWDELTFKYSAYKGNLDILQWLRDEGCPWGRSIRVRESELKPEVIEWLRSNGYGNRLVGR